MFTIYDAQDIVRQRFKPGSAIVDMKFNEVFRFSVEQDTKVIHEYPDMFRPASKEEEEKLKKSGKEYISL